jgi:outer membrane protein assembly factor BamB
VPNKPSLLLVDDLLFMTTDAGVASAVEAKTGSVVWTGRIGGTHSASPVYGDGRVYFFSEDGKTIVVDASRTFRILAENQLGDGFMASPAIDGKAFYLRSKSHLYRIES